MIYFGGTSFHWVVVKNVVDGWVSYWDPSEGEKVSSLDDFFARHASGCYQWPERANIEAHGTKPYPPLRADRVRPRPRDESIGSRRDPRRSVRSTRESASGERC